MIWPGLIIAANGLVRFDAVSARKAGFHETRIGKLRALGVLDFLSAIPLFHSLTSQERHRLVYAKDSCEPYQCPAAESNGNLPPKGKERNPRTDSLPALRKFNLSTLGSSSTPGRDVDRTLGFMSPSEPDPAGRIWLPSPVIQLAVHGRLYRSAAPCPQDENKKPLWRTREGIRP